ncbi:hypothetical protein [Streptomyces sp. NPDC059349]|uniref:hypothetical protein n=1 Tax=Streptomyces sp. NPDC059349 TaxID=3346808 RepID=UPI00368DB561
MTRKQDRQRSNQATGIIDFPGHGRRVGRAQRAGRRRARRPQAPYRGGHPLGLLLAVWVTAASVSDNVGAYT